MQFIDPHLPGHLADERRRVRRDEARRERLAHPVCESRGDQLERSAGHPRRRVVEALTSRLRWVTSLW